MPHVRALPVSGPEPGAVLTKAVLRAAAALGVTAKVLAEVLGLSAASVSRMRRGEFTLEPATKPFELAVLFVRLFRSLDALAGGDGAVVRAWLAGRNAGLGGRPLERIRTVAGLVDVLAYLDARRALV